MTEEQVLHKLMDALLDQNLIGDNQCDDVWTVVSKFIKAGAFDPFMPDWHHAPKYAQYHTIDADGEGVWWSNAGIVLGANAWYHDTDTLNRIQLDTTSPYDLTGLDWRNSLRARPEVQP